MFPDIDRSYWKTQDKAWMAKRQAEWPKIEAMYQYIKKKKGVAPIKWYFLKGQMPNWDAFRDWDDDQGHLDLFSFIWLHPSHDPAVLIPLRDAYIHSDVIVPRDVSRGIGVFLEAGLVTASSRYGPVEGIPWPYTGGRNEQLFDILMGNPLEESVEIQGHTTGGTKSTYRFSTAEIADLFLAGSWLCLDCLSPINLDMLLQYDRPLEWWYRGCVKEKNYFVAQVRSGPPEYADLLREEAARLLEKRVAPVRHILYQIHHFDTDKEGDTCRTTFVRKMRQMLDKREFQPGLKQIWSDVKEGKITIENPWKW